ncbi:TIGR03032 family protein [Pseudomonadales bacterium]|nr:TIGR03032 family protein [Pseudomonadales bacterium]
MTEQNNKDVSQAAPQFEINCSRQFVAWLIEQNISLCFSTYQSGKVFLLGHNEQKSLSVFERTFERAMGLWSDGETLLMSNLYHLHRFNNTLGAGQDADGYDRLYVPRLSHITGELDVHDLALGADGKPVFINTLFSCLATVSDTHSFKPLWQPSFISDLQPEDRCHLNGLAMKDGAPAYVTAISTTNVNEGWREHRQSGGVVIDIESNEIVGDGFSMPHSPRWHNGKLWLANSGTGEFGWVDLASGKFEPVVFCPGYIRGAAFHGNFAILGLSRPRDNKTFNGLALDERLEKEQIAARSGLVVVDLTTGGIPHSLNAEGFISELYDVVVLPGVKRPSMIGFKNDQIRRVLSIE